MAGNAKGAGQTKPFYQELKCYLKTTEIMSQKSKIAKEKIIKDEVKVEKKGWFTTKDKIFLSVLGLLLILFLWKTTQYSRLEKKSALEKGLIIEQSAAFSSNQEKSFLTLIAKPLSWAVRTQMLRSNLDEVDDYFNQMIKENRFEMISLINEDGTIVVCTNKKIEGEKAAVHLGNLSFDTSTTEVQDAKNDTLFVVAPVMGYDKRLGIMVIQYKSEKLQLILGE